MPSPVRIYAGTQEGLFVWRSKNGSWEKVSVAFETGTIDSVDGLKAQPNVVFLGVTQDGLYRTDDAGKSWRRVFEGNVRAVTVDPKCSEAYLQLGVLEVTRHDFDKAIGYYNQAIQANPQLSEAHYRLGMAYDRVGEKAKAQLEEAGATVTLK